MEENVLIFNCFERLRADTTDDFLWLWKCFNVPWGRCDKKASLSSRSTQQRKKNHQKHVLLLFSSLTPTPDSIHTSPVSITVAERIEINQTTLSHLCSCWSGIRENVIRRGSSTLSEILFFPPQGGSIWLRRFFLFMISSNPSQGAWCQNQHCVFQEKCFSWLRWKLH